MSPSAKSIALEPCLLCAHKRLLSQGPALPDQIILDPNQTFEVVIIETAVAWIFVARIRTMMRRITKSLRFNPPV